MDISVIKEQATLRPFKPFEIHLDNGKVYKIKHPEIIITKSLIVTVDDKGEPVLIAPEAVSAITTLEK